MAVQVVGNKIYLKYSEMMTGHTFIYIDGELIYFEYSHFDREDNREYENEYCLSLSQFFTATQQAKKHPNETFVAKGATDVAQIHYTTLSEIPYAHIILSNQGFSSNTPSGASCRTTMHDYIVYALLDEAFSISSRHHAT